MGGARRRGRDQQRGGQREQRDRHLHPPRGGRHQGAGQCGSNGGGGGRCHEGSGRVAGLRYLSLTVPAPSPHPPSPSPLPAQSLNPAIQQVRGRLGLELDKRADGGGGAPLPAGSGNGVLPQLSWASAVAAQAESAVREVNVSRRQADAQLWIAAWRSRSRGNKKAAAHAEAAAAASGGVVDNQQLEQVGGGGGGGGGRGWVWHGQEAGRASREP